ncbi:MAG: hypothetical protein WKF88_10830, partial [Ferruginibacter sp.]
MFKKLLSLFLLIFILLVAAQAQPVNVGSVTVPSPATNRFATCGNAAPTVTATFVAANSPGSTVTAGGQIVCNNACDTTTIDIIMAGLQWNQAPGINWIHSIYVPAQAGILVTQNPALPTFATPYIFIPGGCTGTCPQGGVISGGTGFYYVGAGQSCCPGGGATTNLACDNWGDGSKNCGVSFTYPFRIRICNNQLVANTPLIVKVRADSDGNTGCWVNADLNPNTVIFTLDIGPGCTPLYSTPTATNTPITKTCSPTQYSTTLNATCGNSTSVTWWTAATGGTQVGTGSPFTYITTSCPGTIYAACCPVSSVCATRKAYAFSGGCPPNIAMTAPNVQQPTCATPTGSVSVPQGSVFNASGATTFTLTPGGGTNSTGSFNGLVPGAYTLTVMDAVGCSAFQNFTINPPASAARPHGNEPVNYCQNAVASPLTTTSGTNILYYTVATGGTGVTTFTPPTTPVGSTTYYASQNPSGSCESSRTPILVNVSANSTITLTSAGATTNQTVCVNTAITNITYSTANGVTGATVTGLPAGVTGTYSGGTNGTVSISGTPPSATGVFNYTVTTSGGCGVATASGTITVSTAATLTLTSAPATTTQTVCINTAITDITYNAGGGATGSSVTGLPAGVTGVFAAGVVTISGTPTAAGTFPYTVTTTGGCGVVTLTGTITVNPNATLTLTSAAATTTQTICVNTPLTNITYSIAGGATGATVTGLPAGITGSFAGGVFTISGTPTATGTFPYTITTSGGCTTPTATGTITVSTAATLVLSSAPSTTTQTLCINTAITDITYTGGGGTTGATVTGLPAGVTGTYAGGTVTITGTPTASGSFPYSVTTTGGCGVITLSGTITVNPNATITLTSAAATTTQTICVNTALTDITYSTASGATGATVTGLPAGITGTFAGGLFTISGTPTATGTFPYTVTTSGGCTTPTATGTITVNPTSTLVLSSAPATTSQTLCINTAITNITYTAGGGTTGATVTGLPAGVTGTFAGGTFTISGTPTVAGPFSYTVTTTGTCGTVVLTGSITVNPDVTITLTSAAATTTQTICVN